MVLLTVGWTFPHQSSIKIISYRHDQETKMMEVILQLEAVRSRSEEMRGGKKQVRDWRMLGLAFEEKGPGYSSVHLAGTSNTYFGIYSSQNCKVMRHGFKPLCRRPSA